MAHRVPSSFANEYFLQIEIDDHNTHAASRRRHDSPRITHRDLSFGRQLCSLWLRVHRKSTRNRSRSPHQPSGGQRRSGTDPAIPGQRHRRRQRRHHLGRQQRPRRNLIHRHNFIRRPLHRARQVSPLLPPLPSLPSARPVRNPPPQPSSPSPTLSRLASRPAMPRFLRTARRSSPPPSPAPEICRRRSPGR